MEDCNCFIGFSLNTRDESFERYYLDELKNNINIKNEIDDKFDYCPFCGKEIEW